MQQQVQQGQQDTEPSRDSRFGKKLEVLFKLFSVLGLVSGLIPIV